MRKCCCRLLKCLGTLFLVFMVSPLQPAAGGQPLQLPESGPAPWTKRDFYNDPDHFQFVIVSDRTGGHRDGVFEQAIAKINDLRPEFVICVGDLIEGLTGDLEQVDREWRHFNSLLEPLAMRFFYVPGNHDIWDSESRRQWEARFGSTYYHFVYKNVLFLCLNSEDDGPTRLSEEQVAFVKRTLAENTEVRWTFIFLHKALWSYQQDGRPTRWSELEESLAKRAHTVFAGHRHQYASHEHNNYKYYELATTGGASNLRGPVHGRFDHVVWVTMDESGPILANLRLDGILGAQLRTREEEQIVRALTESYDLSIEPISLSTDEPFHAGTTSVRITNRASIPVHVEAQFPSHAMLRPDPYAFSATIEAESSQAIQVLLESRAESGFTGTEILPLDLSLTYRPEGLKQPLVWEQTLFATVDRAVLIPDVDPRRPPVLDGSLDEWPDLPYSAERPMQLTGAASTWSGPQDSSFRFGLLQDQNFLYIGIQVRDDQVVHRPGSQSRYQDLAGFLLDARSEADRVSGGAAEGSEGVARVFIIPQPEGAPIIIPPSRSGASSLQAWTSDSKNGYSVECAIPHSLLDEIQGTAWESIRLNLFLHDTDSLTGSRIFLWWRPNWGNLESYEGSGTFARARLQE